MDKNNIDWVGAYRSLRKANANLQSEIAVVVQESKQLEIENAQLKRRNAYLKQELLKMR